MVSIVARSQLLASLAFQALVSTFGIFYSSFCIYSSWIWPKRASLLRSETTTGAAFVWTPWVISIRFPYCSFIVRMRIVGLWKTSSLTWMKVLDPCSERALMSSPSASIIYTFASSLLIATLIVFFLSLSASISSKLLTTLNYGMPGTLLLASMYA